jgi:hypothetical protein
MQLRAGALLCFAVSVAVLGVERRAARAGGA